jgi:hypothetical protein
MLLAVALPPAAASCGAEDASCTIEGETCDPDAEVDSCCETTRCQPTATGEGVCLPEDDVIG